VTAHALEQLPAHLDSAACRRRHVQAAKQLLPRGLDRLVETLQVFRRGIGLVGARGARDRLRGGE